MLPCCRLPHPVLHDAFSALHTILLHHRPAYRILPPYPILLQTLLVFARRARACIPPCYGRKSTHTTTNVQSAHSQSASWLCNLNFHPLHVNTSCRRRQHARCLSLYHPNCISQPINWTTDPGRPELPLPLLKGPWPACRLLGPMHQCLCGAHAPVPVWGACTHLKGRCAHASFRYAGSYPDHHC